MPCIYVNWKKGKTPEQKQEIRTRIANEVSETIGVGPNLVSIFFHDMPEEDVPYYANLIWVYWTVGRSDEDKDTLVRIITDAIHDVTGDPVEIISIMIFDLPQGNLAGSGRILNRGGSVADQLMTGKTLDECE